VPLAHSATGAGLPALAPVPVLLLAGILYLRAFVRVRRRRVGWSLLQAISFLAGLVAIAAAVLPPVASHDEEFPVHVTQHLLLAMAAPLLLALSAPVTLMLRTLRPDGRRRVARALHLPLVRVVAHPLAAALVDLVPLYVLYLTPLYGYSLAHPTTHELLHAHFLLAGCLFTWAVVGADPVPGRASIRTRSIVIVLAFAAHATLAKLMYARGPDTAGAAEVSDHAWRVGAQLMWYGGDAIELVLVAAFALQWYRLEGRRLRRSHQLLAAESTPR
jgi:putative membrane protein